MRESGLNWALASKNKKNNYRDSTSLYCGTISTSLKVRVVGIVLFEKLET